MSVELPQFELDETKVEEKMINFRRTVMEDEQRKITAEMSKFLSEHIGISHNVLRSFVSLAISMWQAKENKLVKEINDQSPEIRYQHVKAICKHFEELLIPVLQNKVDAADFKNGIGGALKLYKQLRADNI